MKDFTNNQRGRQQKPPPREQSTLSVFIDYLIKNNRSGLLARLYKNGALPYNPQAEPITVYLHRNAYLIYEKEGLKGLFEIHPDKEIILDFFAEKIPNKENCKENQVLKIEQPKKCQCSHNKELDEQNNNIEQQYFYIESRKNGKSESYAMTKLICFALLLIGGFFLLRTTKKI